MLKNRFRYRETVLSDINLSNRRRIWSWETAGRLLPPPSAVEREGGRGVGEERGDFIERRDRERTG